MSFFKVPDLSFRSHVEYGGMATARPCASAGFTVLPFTRRVGSVIVVPHLGQDPLAWFDPILSYWFSPRLKNAVEVGR
jgi:hypothetical protein